MSLLPRILTVDSTGVVPRLVRAVIDLTDQMIIQTDVPNAAEALNEVSRGDYQMLISALTLEGDIDGLELCRHALGRNPNISVVLVAEADEPEVELEGNSVLVRRPLNAHQFLRILDNGVNGRDLMAGSDSVEGAMSSGGAVPPLDVTAAGKIVDSLLRDISPISLILASRTGEVLLERGSEKRLNRDQLTAALLPAMQSSLQMGPMVGGKISALSFFDGDTYDIFMLGIGYHHLLCLVFDGRNGAKQIGAVRSYAQRAVQDLVALLAGQAYTIAPAASAPPKRRTQSVRVIPAAVQGEQELRPVAVKAESFSNGASGAAHEEPRIHLDPIENFDPSLLEQLESLDLSDADALFDPDNLAEIAKMPGREGGLLSDEEARRLGIVQ